MSKKSGGKKGKHVSKKQIATRIEKMLERMDAWRVKAHLERKPKSSRSRR